MRKKRERIRGDYGNEKRKVYFFDVSINLRYDNVKVEMTVQ